MSLARQDLEEKVKKAELEVKFALIDLRKDHDFLKGSVLNKLKNKAMKWPNLKEDFTDCYLKLKSKKVYQSITQAFDRVNTTKEFLFNKDIINQDHINNGLINVICRVDDLDKYPSLTLMLHNIEVLERTFSLLKKTSVSHQFVALIPRYIEQLNQISDLYRSDLYDAELATKPCETEVSPKVSRPSNALFQPAPEMHQEESSDDEDVLHMSSESVRGITAAYERRALQRPK